MTGRRQIGGGQRPVAALFVLFGLLLNVAGATGAQLDRDPRAARAVEMAYFGGMAQNEIACVLEVSLPTVERDLRFARAWLSQQLS